MLNNIYQLELFTLSIFVCNKNLTLKLFESPN